MKGTWTVTRNRVTPVHTFTAPEEGWLVNSHIIELPTQLLIVDAQYRLSCARYAAELRKPLSRLYVTHYHPDHLLGAVEFAAPVFALRSVAEKIDMAGDRVAREEHQLVGDDVPKTVRRVDRCITEGEEIAGGVRIVRRHVRIVHRHPHCAETDDALINQAVLAQYGATTASADRCRSSGRPPPGYDPPVPGRAPEAAAQLPLRRREVASQSNHVICTCRSISRPERPELIIRIEPVKITSGSAHLSVGTTRRPS
jgi:Metallo-beta-lactamase superfamily